MRVTALGVGLVLLDREPSGGAGVEGHFRDRTGLHRSNLAGLRAMLDLYGREAWHFPRGEDGEYSWYYPPDGPSVIAHLETCGPCRAYEKRWPDPLSSIRCL